MSYVADDVETAIVCMEDASMKRLEVCGRIPNHKGQRAIIVTDGARCFAARLTPHCWTVIEEPVQLYPIRERTSALLD